VSIAGAIERLSGELRIPQVMLANSLHELCADALENIGGILEPNQYRASGNSRRKP
jgi:hypothetical protein